MDPYPKNVSHPTKCLCVRSQTFKQDTTTEHIQSLLDDYGVVGADEPHMTKDEANLYAIVKFENASSASEAVERVKEKNRKDGKETITVSSFVHDEYAIADDVNRYKQFIGRLRDLFAHGEDDRKTYLVEAQQGGQEATHPILRKHRGGAKPHRWIHIKLIAAAEPEQGHQESATTLVIRDDNLYVIGFTNKDGKWFELYNKVKGEKLPEEEYNATQLEGWGIMYDDLMKLNDTDQVKNTLNSTKLGKAFAERAVRSLSRYYCKEAAGGVIDDIPVRLGLAGLIVMICESARLNSILEHFAGKAGTAGCWNLEKGLELETSKFIWHWGSMSKALRKWKKSDGKDKWDNRCGVESPNEALTSVHLVLNAKRINADKAHVEILQVSAKFDVDDNGKVIADKNTDEEQKIVLVQQDGGQANDEQADKKMAVMVPKGISGYASFDIELSPRAGGRNKWMTCDCRKDDRVEYQLVTRDMTFSAGAADDRNNRTQITYLVMSNAVQATLEIKLRLPASEGSGGSNYTAHGRIYAYISDIDADNFPIVLFATSQPIGFTSSSSDWTLKVDRSASANSAPVRVPQGKQLQIDMGNLCIVGPDVNEELKNHMEKLYFEGAHVSGNGAVKNGNNGRIIINFDIKDSRAAIIPIGGDRGFEVKVTWKGVRAKTITPEVVCDNIASKNEFSTCIDQLREEIAKGCQDPVDSDHPVLKSQRQEWIHVQLQTKAGDDGEESATTTLAIGVHKCNGVGFLNQSGVWYELCDKDEDKTLPATYNSVPLGAYYKDIVLGGVNNWEKVEEKMDFAVVSRKDFATRAVRTLSRYPDVDVDARLALAGIILMVCESAKLNSLRDYFLDTWDKGSSTRYSKEDLKDHIGSWEDRSRDLLYLRDHDNGGEHISTSVLKIMRPRAEAALRTVHLVFNYFPRQIDMEYTIDDDATKFTKFIKDLRTRLANHEDKDQVVHDGRSSPVLGRFRLVQPARWFNIKLQLRGETTSTTLAVRDDTVYVRGFKNQNDTWYDLGYAGRSDSKILPTEYRAQLLGWGFSYAQLLKVESLDKAVKQLDSPDEELIVRNLVTNAVRTLSCYGCPDGQRDEAVTRLALARLALMISGSARLHGVLQHFVDGLVNRTPLKISQDQDLRTLLCSKEGWPRISRALLRWKKADFPPSGWDPEDTCEGTGIRDGDHALETVALVFGAKLYHVSRPSSSRNSNSRSG